LRQNLKIWFDKLTTNGGRELKKKAYEKPVLARHGLLRKLTKTTW